MFLGTLTVAFLLIPLNAFLATLAAVSFLDLIVIFFKFLQPLNAFFSIILTLAPITRVVSFLLFLKAFDLIDFTLNVFPLILTVAGIVIFLEFFLPLANPTVFVLSVDIISYLIPLTVYFWPFLIFEEEPDVLVFPSHQYLAYLHLV